MHQRIFGIIDYTANKQNDVIFIVNWNLYFNRGRCVLLHTLSDIPVLDADTTIRELWTFGLVRFIEVEIPFTNDK